jgi:hypothetical protein
MLLLPLCRDWSQAPTGMPQGSSVGGIYEDETDEPYGLALKLIDSCGTTLIDTITQASFKEPPEGEGIPDGETYYIVISAGFAEAASLQLSCPDAAFDAISPPVCI